MSDQLKENLKEHSTWVRGLYMLLFIIIFEVAKMVTAAVVVFQFLLKLLTRDTNPRLTSFGQGLGTFVNQIILFLTYNTEDKPFPFGDWPAAGTQDMKPAAKKKKAAKSKKVLPQTGEGETEAEAEAGEEGGDKP